MTRNAGSVGSAGNDSMPWTADRLSRNTTMPLRTGVHGVADGFEGEGRVGASDPGPGRFSDQSLHSRYVGKKRRVAFSFRGRLAGSLDRIHESTQADA